MINIILLRYSQVCKPGYNFGTERFQIGTGHFTQVCYHVLFLMNYISFKCNGVTVCQ